MNRLVSIIAICIAFTFTEALPLSNDIELTANAVSSTPESFRLERRKSKKSKKDKKSKKSKKNKDACITEEMCFIEEGVYDITSKKLAPDNCDIDDGVEECEIECTTENCSNGELLSDLFPLVKASCESAIAALDFQCPQPCDSAIMCKFGTEIFLVNGQATVPSNELICLADDLNTCTFECSAENCINGELESGLSDLAKATCTSSSFQCPQPCNPVAMCKFGTEVFYHVDGQANLPLNCLAKDLQECQATCSDTCTTNGDFSPSPLFQAACAEYNCPIEVEGNLILNPSFESNPGCDADKQWCWVSDEHIPGWTSGNGKIEIIEYIGWPAKDGGYSIALAAVGSEEYFIHQVVELEELTDYKLKFWMRMDTYEGAGKGYFNVGGVK
jgi:hypothetical protein